MYRFVDVPRDVEMSGLVDGDVADVKDVWANTGDQRVSI